MKIIGANSLLGYTDLAVETAAADINSVSVDSDSTGFSINSGAANFTIAGGNAITTSATGTTLTVTHDDTSTLASINNGGVTYIQDLTFDTYGHVTGATSVAVRGATTSSIGVASFSADIFTVSEEYSVSLEDNAIQTGHIQDDVVTFAKASGVSPKVFGNTIKLLPSDFMSNDDGGSTKFGIGFVEADGTSFGMKVPNADTELLALVSIPEGMKATHVDIFDKAHDRAVAVFEANVNSRTITAKGTGNCNTTIDITDVNATAVNYLLILITTTATSDRVYGGTVTIAAQ